MRKSFWAVFIIGIAAAAFFASRNTRQAAFVSEQPVLHEMVSAQNAPAVIAPNGRVELTRVTRVIDGDTVVLEGGEHVRYIGMDTPETVDPRKPVQCFGVEAVRRNKEFALGKSVRLVKDVSDRDRYGRLLRYVYLENGTFVNLELVKEGYARASTFPPDVKFASEFVAAEKAAREAKRGLWASCLQ